MTGHHAIARIANLELAILSTLCAHTTSKSERQYAFQELAGYVWSEADRAVAYEAITRVGSHDPKNWREELPAQTTRMGFPDLDWTVYLTPRAGAQASLEELVGKLKEAAASCT